MGRGLKIALGAIAVLVVAIAANAVVVDGETESAHITVPGGRLLDLPGGEMQIAEGGPRQAQPIVLIHGFSCAIDWWDRLRPALEAGHRVIAVDLLGHGGSGKPADDYTPTHQAEVVAQALRALHVRDAVIVGHSLGGMVASALAQQDPDLVERVAMIDTPPDDTYGDLGLLAKLAFTPVVGEALWTIKPDASVRDGLEVAFAPGYDVPDAFVEDVNRMTYPAYDESPERADDFRGETSIDTRMRGTGKPLMVLMGAEEQIIDDPQRALTQYRRGDPGAETHLILGAGHSPHVEKPAETAQLVLAFAKKGTERLRSAARDKAERGG